jgi:four helix bundle protein
MKYDLEKRIIEFSKSIIIFIKGIRKESKYNKDIDSLLNQLFRSSTSIGSNYMEANNSCSKKDFKNKIAIARKEAKETEYWIEMLSTYLDNDKEKMRLLWKEAREINLILSKIFNSLKY